MKKTYQLHYKVKDKKSRYYGYTGVPVSEAKESVLIELVKDKAGKRCYEGRQEFSRKDLEQINKKIVVE